jgi:serine/threonine-protein kinase
MDLVFLKRYQHVRLLGEGRTGCAYLARQVDLGRPVVVKVIGPQLASDPYFCQRFLQEAAPMARFQHPYAVTLYDVSLEDPRGPILVMEYVQGITLDSLLLANRGRLSPGRVNRLLGQLCDALQAAHDEGIVHGNLKPANIIVLEADSPYEKIKVLEFGFAWLLAPAKTEGANGRTLDTETVNGQGGDPAMELPVAPSPPHPLAPSPRDLLPLVTPYLSPEQLAGDIPTLTGDIYSIGVILFELLTGTLPARSSEAEDLTPGSGILRGSPTALPSAVEAVLLGCLERDPEQRIHNPRELAELFEAALTQRTKRTRSKPVVHEDASLRHVGDPEQKVIDAQAVVYHLEAYMPHALAEHKLRGFVQDAGGELLESVPGLIRVRLGDPETKYELKKGLFSWFDRRTGLIEMYLRVRASDEDRRNMVVLTVLLRCMDGDPPDDPAWRARCTCIYQDLRGYLMAQDVVMPKK